MINFTERKAKLMQDINAQRAEIERIEAALEQAQVLLHRLEGAAMACDEFLQQEKAEASKPVESETVNA